MTDFLVAGIQKRGIGRIGLFEPKATMVDESSDFFRGKLTSSHNIEVIIPQTQAEIDEVNRGMFQELMKGKDAVTPHTRQMFLDAANRLIGRGAQD